jgi:hypothetical protein
VIRWIAGAAVVAACEAIALTIVGVLLARGYYLEHRKKERKA